MTKTNKKIGKRIIKKLKAIEVKREPFKKLDNNSKKKEEIQDKTKEKSEFHEDILEKSTEFATALIKTEEPKIDNNSERVENLEEFASTLPPREVKDNEKPYSTNNAYGPTGNSGTYDSDTRYDTSEKYDSGSAFDNNRTPALRTNTINAFGTPVFGNRQDERGKEGLTANRLEESARLSEQYRRERETANREAAGAHQSKSKRELF